ncbi:MAG: hypothetical protein IPK04_19750 [Bdellovibrionales bacterium]|nr:hypothetical protein [Bdellovibrionales bacterium]
MAKICEETQSLIAVGAELSSQGAEHAKSCGKCSLLLSEYQSLALLVSDSMDFEVPSGFADAVMNKIEMEEKSLQNDWLQKCVSTFERLMAIPQTQYLALGLGGAVSLLNLAKFVFFVLIPVQ